MLSRAHLSLICALRCSRALFGAAFSLTLLFTSGCEDSCSDGGREYENGATWTCSDGCNSCACEDGEVSSTLAGCAQPPGPKAGKLDCNEGGQSHQHGATWVCADACQECSCDDGRVSRASRECAATP
jgi:hypothetical protein